MNQPADRSSPRPVPEAREVSPPPDLRGEVARSYEGVIRAMDTKAQIFIALLTLTLAPFANRLDAADATLPIRVAAARLFCAAVLFFVMCLIPRVGRRPRGPVFDPDRAPAAVRAHFDAPGFAVDHGEAIETLHAIYCAKTRHLRVGVILLGLHLAALGAALVFA